MYPGGERMQKDARRAPNRGFTNFGLSPVTIVAESRMEDQPLASTRRTFWTTLPIVLAIMSATALPLCGQMFRCGCSFAHGSAMCNIHHQTMPHCPWCQKSGTAFAASFLAVIPITGGTIFVLARRRKSIWLCSLAGTSAYLISAIAAGWVTAKVMGYATWFG